MRKTFDDHFFLLSTDCELFKTGVYDDYLIKDQKGKAAITSWWAGEHAGIIDTNNERAVAWWRERLDKLRTDYGIDSFKFDAGEVNWLPYSRQLEGDQSRSPNIYTVNIYTLNHIFYIKTTSFTTKPNIC